MDIYDIDRLFPMNGEERRNKEMYLSPDRELLYGSPLNVAQYEALPKEYRVLDETFEKYNSREPDGYFGSKFIHTAENDIFVDFTRSLRYTLPFLHKHSFVELIYVYHGECVHYIDGDVHLLKEGDFCIVGPDSVHAVENDHDDDILFTIMVSMEFFGSSFLNLLRKNEQISEFFDNILKGKRFASCIVYPTGDDPWMHWLTLHLYNENITKDYLYNESVSASIRQIFIHLLRNYENDAVISLSSAPERHYPFVALINYLTVHFDSATLHSTARDFGYSDVYLGQLIKQVTGKSFTQYIAEIQLDRACAMLTDTSLSITEIAHCIGCYDSSHFTNKFRKKYGVAPSVYRRRHGGSG